MEEIDVRGIEICNMFFIKHSLQKIVNFFLHGRENSYINIINIHSCCVVHLIINISGNNESEIIYGNIHKNQYHSEENNIKMDP